MCKNTSLKIAGHRMAVICKISSEFELLGPSDASAQVCFKERKFRAS